MSGARALVVTAEDAPGQELVFTEHELARARATLRRQPAELRATNNFIRVERDDGFIAVVEIDFGEGIGVREVLVDPLGIGQRLRAATGR